MAIISKRVCLTILKASENYKLLMRKWILRRSFKTFQNSWNSDRNGVACNAVHTGGISSYLEIVLPYNDTEKL